MVQFEEANAPKDTGARSKYKKKKKNLAHLLIVTTKSIALGGGLNLMQSQVL